MFSHAKNHGRFFVAKCRFGHTVALTALAASQALRFLEKAAEPALALEEKAGPTASGSGGSTVESTSDSHADVARQRSDDFQDLRSTSFVTGATATRTTTGAGVSKVVRLLEIMAENDDIYTPLDILRRQLLYDTDKQDSEVVNWIEEAVASGKVIRFNRPDVPGELFCLAQYHGDATAPYPKNVDTSKEAQFVAYLLRKKWWVDAKDDCHSSTYR